MNLINTTGTRKHIKCEQRATKIFSTLILILYTFEQAQLANHNIMWEFQDVVPGPYSLRSPWVHESAEAFPAVEAESTINCYTMYMYNIMGLGVNFYKLMYI